MIEQFHFIRPGWLLFIVAGLLVVTWLWRRGVRSSNWEQACDAHLLRHLLIGHESGASRLPLLGLGAAWTFAGLALAGPAWERLPQPVYSSMEGRVLVMDLSRSMDSTDLPPSRLVRARYKLSDLVTAGASLQQGLVVFAGDAFTVAPLTDDVDTLLNLIPALDSDTVPVQGSESHLAIDRAVQLLQAAGVDHGEIILIADEVSPESVTAAANASREGYRLSVLAAATTEGAPVPLPGGGLLKDSRGNIVIPGMDPQSLQAVAAAGGGAYATLSADDADIDVLGTSWLTGHRLEAARSGADDNLLQGDQWADTGPWLLLPLIGLAAMAFRRNWLLLLMAFSLPLPPEPVQAFGWDDLWLRQDQKAARLFQDEHFERVDREAPAPWQGAAQYRLGDYETAAETFATDTNVSAAGHYNQGNALARSGALEEAVAAYNRAIELDPEMEDATFNRDLVRALMQQQPPPQNSQQEQEQDQDEDSQQKSSQNQEGSGEQGDSSSDQEREEDSQSSASTAENEEQSGHEDEMQEPGEEEESQEDPGEPQQAAVDPPEQQQEMESEAGDPEDPQETPGALSEKELALEQWLRRVPDDPGGLLRRKFAWQYGQRTTPEPEKKW